jgi:hypothetical protein
LANVLLRHVGHSKPSYSAAVHPPRTAAGSYTLDKSELCDRLPHNQVAKRILMIRI